MVDAQNPTLPPSPSTKAIETLKRKIFSKIEIEKLLWAVININPYMVPQRQVMTYWFCCYIFVSLSGVKILNIVLYMSRRGVYACVRRWAICVRPRGV